MNGSKVFGFWPARLATALLMLSCFGVPKAEGQALVELYCRGGPGLQFRPHANPSPRNPQEVTLELVYRRSPTAAGVDGSGLAPGSCAWGLRDGLPPEPARLYFDTPANAGPPEGADLNAAVIAWPDANSIPSYLGNPAHFWKFAVESGASAPAVVSYLHSVWQGVQGTVVFTEPPADTAGPARRRTPGGTTRTGAGIGTSGPDRPRTPGGTTSDVGRLNTRLRDVRVEPTDRNVVITFKARPGARPFVRLAAPQGATRGWHVGSVGQGEYRFDFSLYNRRGHREAPRGWELEPGGSYGFTIEVPAGDGVEAQSESGTFNTWNQTVTVQFTELKVLDDSDDSGSGELMFQAEALRRATPDELQNTATPYISIGRMDAFALGGRATAPAQWNTGHQEVYRPPVELIVERAPSQFRLVIGGEDDDDDASCYDSSGFLSVEIRRDPAPSKNCKRERNFAIYQVDVSRHPGSNVRVPFYVHSMIGHGGVALAFEVRGFILITRQ
jgi:hypothetical protein